MDSNTFPKVTAGMPRSASPANNARWLNAVSDTAAWYQQQVAGGQIGPGSPSQRQSTGLVTVQNLTGAARLRGHVVQLNDYLLTELDHRNLWFQGLLPSDPLNRIAILRVAVKENDIAPAQVSGVCTAVVNVTDLAHSFAEPAADSHLLTSAESGSIQLLTTPTVTGEQEIVVLLGAAASGLRRGKATTAITAADGLADADRGYGSVQFYKADGTADGDPVEVMNPFWDAFVINSIVKVDLALTPPELVSVGCTVAS